jgi:hypothetical protein
MLQFDNRQELSAAAAGTVGGPAAPPPRPGRREPTPRLWGFSAVNRDGFSDAISGAPSPQTGRGASFPEVAATNPERPHHARLERGVGADPLDLEFMSEEELRDLRAPHTARRDAEPARALTLEQVVRSLLELGLDADPLDLEFMSEEELRDLHARHATGAKERSRPADNDWAFDDVAFS